MNITDFDADTQTVYYEQLCDRVYLLTGAAGAIGGAVATALGEAGASVILLDRNSRGMDNIYDRILELGGPEPAKLELDLATAGTPQYEELADVIASEFGRLDGIIHNAIEPGTLTPLSQYPLESWNKSLLVNLNAPYMLTRCCLPLLSNSDHAAVIFSSSSVARKGKAYWGAYSVTGFALEGLAQVWSDELETNTEIRINTIDPGAVKSFLRTRYYPGELPNAVPAADTVVPAYLYLLTSNVNRLALRIT